VRTHYLDKKYSDHDLFHGSLVSPFDNWTIQNFPSIQNVGRTSGTVTVIKTIMLIVFLSSRIIIIITYDMKVYSPLVLNFSALFLKDLMTMILVHGCLKQTSAYNLTFIKKVLLKLYKKDS